MTGALSPTALANAAHSIGPGLLAAALAVPLVMLAACLSQGLRRHMLALQWLAPLPAPPRLNEWICDSGSGPRRAFRL
jgi:hypothetical protein